VLALALTMGVVLAGAGTAAAADTRPFGPATTDLTFRLNDPFPVVHGSSSVRIWWGFDYNPANNHLRGWGELSADNGSTHVQAEPLNLGDRNGVLKSTTANSQNGFLEVETDAVDCHPNGVYISNLHYSIRWPDGTLTSGQTGQFEAAASLVCT
jgi:hypothetical protein